MDGERIAISATMITLLQLGSSFSHFPLEIAFSDRRRWVPATSRPSQTAGEETEARSRQEYHFMQSRDPHCIMTRYVFQTEQPSPERCPILRQPRHTQHDVSASQVPRRKS